MDRDTAILVKRIGPDDDASLAEIADLARSAGYSVADTVTQKGTEDQGYEIGRGKAHEVGALAREHDADAVVFDNPLGPFQVYNLGNAIPAEVLDRFTLILEIFGDRAGSRKAQLQVELAELQYELPRADAKASLAKRDERPGFMGLGEYDEGRKGDIKKQISRIRDELDALGERDRQWRRERRDSGFDLVALAGYTNAGKSTLMRALADVDTSHDDHPDVPSTAEPDDELFTTLGTTTRSMEVPGRDVLLSDTVGFISDLPHWLVESFESTLDEVYLADVVLLVVDASDPVDEIRDKLVTCHDALWERAEGTLVTVLNKTDLLTEEELEERRAAVEYLSPDAVAVSAREGDGLDELVARVKDELPDWEEVTVELPMSDDGMSTVSWLYDNADVRSVEYGDAITVEFAARDDVIARARDRSPLEASVGATTS